MNTRLTRIRNDRISIVANNFISQRLLDNSFNNSIIGNNIIKTIIIIKGKYLPTKKAGFGRVNRKTLKETRLLQFQFLSSTVTPQLIPPMR